MDKELRQIRKALILIFWALCALVGAVIGTANAADHAVGDLKCVTIKFKNDSELKLKTQWFINACDTTENIVWVKHQYWDSSSVKRDLAQLDHLGLKYEWIMQDRGLIRWQVIKETVSCRTLLWPPNVRREPVISSGYYRYYAGGHVTISDSLVVADTTEGEALLWYKERSDENVK